MGLSQDESEFLHRQLPVFECDNCKLSIFIDVSIGSNYTELVPLPQIQIGALKFLFNELIKVGADIPLPRDNLSKY